MKRCFFILCLAAGAGNLTAQTKPPATKDTAAKDADDPAKRDPIMAREKAVASTMDAALKAQQDAIKKQADGIRQQLGLAPISDPAFIEPLISPPKSVDCPPLADADVDALVAGAAKKESIQPALIRAVMKQESGFKPCAISDKGAQGLMQLMPATADEFHVTDPFDPQQSVEGGAALLKKLLDKYKGDVKLTLAAYNAGANMVDNAGGVPDPKETQDYVASIMAALGADKNTANGKAAQQPNP